MICSGGGMENRANQQERKPNKTWAVAMTLWSLSCKRQNRAALRPQPKDVCNFYILMEWIHLFKTHRQTQMYPDSLQTQLIKIQNQQQKINLTTPRAMRSVSDRNKSIRLPAITFGLLFLFWAYGTTISSAFDTFLQLIIKCFHALRLKTVPTCEQSGQHAFMQMW